MTREACVAALLRRFPSDGLLAEDWAAEEERLRGTDRWERFRWSEDALTLYRSWREFAVETYRV